MTSREGSLDAPTRHPIAWQDPDFTDPAKLEQAYLELTIQSVEYRAEATS